MNVNDSDYVRRFLADFNKNNGVRFEETSEEASAQVILTNTCAIREHAEAKIWHRLQELRNKNKQKLKPLIGVLGCMAERLREQLQSHADLVVGPDDYRKVPQLLAKLLKERGGANNEPIDMDTAVMAHDYSQETYADVTPLRVESSISAYVSIQRGCNNRCSFCIVPVTRGPERSRPLDSIVDEIRVLYEQQGVKEVTLLGQNVNSYRDRSHCSDNEEGDSRLPTLSNPGFRQRQRLRGGGGYYFVDLLQAVSDISPELRIRFTSPHPKDYPRELLTLMAERPNIAKHLHLPAQSGSTAVLARMKRGYARAAYLELVETARQLIPQVALSSDFITGFCGETEEEHADTLSLLSTVRYDQAFMFAYSRREQTHAGRTMEDNVPHEVKQQRLREIIDLFHTTVHAKNQEEVGQVRLVLVESPSKRHSDEAWQGRTDQNKRIFFPVNQVDAPECWAHADLEPWLQGVAPVESLETLPRVPLQAGDYAAVLVTQAKGPSLRGSLLWRTTAAAFHSARLVAAGDAEVTRAAQQLARALSL
jgi:MiaB/RimO family radical SAM methylthiotransferase